jgi:hypothetical protein
MAILERHPTDGGADGRLMGDRAQADSSNGVSTSSPVGSSFGSSSGTQGDGRGTLMAHLCAFENLVPGIKALTRDGGSVASFGKKHQCTYREIGIVAQLQWLARRLIGR